MAPIEVLVGLRVTVLRFKAMARHCSILFDSNRMSLFGTQWEGMESYHTSAVHQLLLLKVATVKPPIMDYLRSRITSVHTADSNPAPNMHCLEDPFILKSLL